MTKAFEHYCWCGQWGAFGYGVSLLKDKPGTWYCREHRPDRPLSDEELFDLLDGKFPIVTV